MVQNAFIYSCYMAHNVTYLYHHAHFLLFTCIIKMPVLSTVAGLLPILLARSATSSHWNGLSPSPLFFYVYFIMILVTILVKNLNGRLFLSSYFGSPMIGVMTLRYSMTHIHQCSITTDALNTNSFRRDEVFNYLFWHTVLPCSMSCTSWLSHSMYCSPSSSSPSNNGP